MLTVLLFLVTVGLAAAQVPHLGGCPDIKVQENFNLTRYLGDWYEVSKFFFYIEGQETCIRANYSIRPDNHVQVSNTGIKSDGTTDVAIGDAIVADPNEPAKFSVSFYDSPRVPYWVVKTDYETYSLVWSCSSLGSIVQADFAWILGRSPTLDAKTVTMLKDILATYKINVNSFMDTKQANCPKY